MTFSEPASKETLIRRLYFDLTGLPPTVEEVDSFLNNSSEGAYTELVDKHCLILMHMQNEWLLIGWIYLVMLILMGFMPTDFVPCGHGVIG